MIRNLRNTYSSELVKISKSKSSGSSLHMKIFPIISYLVPDSSFPDNRANKVIGYLFSGKIGFHLKNVLWLVNVNFKNSLFSSRCYIVEHLQSNGKILSGIHKQRSRIAIMLGGRRGKGSIRFQSCIIENTIHLESLSNTKKKS